MDLWSLIECFFRNPSFDMQTFPYADTVCVMIPGIWGNAMCFQNLSTHLQTKFKYNIETFHYSALQDINTIFNQLDTFLKHERFNNKKIVMLGHSYGGCVAEMFQTKYQHKSILQIHAIAPALSGARVLDAYKYLMGCLKQLKLTVLFDIIKKVEKDSGFTYVINTIETSRKGNESTYIYVGDRDYITGKSPDKNSHKSSSAHQNILRDRSLIDEVATNISNHHIKLT